MSEFLAPTVSVIIPAYNAARWIAATLDSVLAQTFRDFEVIVVDDGSSDRTCEVAAGYAGAVQYLRKENGGAASARNVGIHASRGSYIAFVDADDLWLPEKLQLQMELFSSYQDVAWLYSDAIVFDGETGRDLYKLSQGAKPHAGDILRPLLLGNFIPSPTPVIRRDVFGAVGYFDESSLLHAVEDWDMWLRIAANYPVRFVNRPLARYRLHATSTTGAIDFEYRFRSLLLTIENARTRNPERLSDLGDRALANMCVGMAGTMLRRGNRLGARGMITRAVSLYPYKAKALAYWLATFLPAPVLNWLFAVHGRNRRWRIFTGRVS